MSTIVPVRATLTASGLAAIAAEIAAGGRGQISQLAFGTGGSVVLGQPRGYEPTGDETALRAEVLRMPVAAAVQVGPREWMAEASAPALAPNTPPQWITEVGAFLTDGTMLGLWSRPTGPLFARTDVATALVGFTIAFTELPANSVEFVAVGTPSIPMSLVATMANMIAGQAELLEAVTALHLKIEAAETNLRNSLARR